MAAQGLDFAHIVSKERQEPPQQTARHYTFTPKAIEVALQDEIRFTYLIIASQEEKNS